MINICFLDAFQDCKDNIDSETLSNFMSTCQVDICAGEEWLKPSLDAFVDLCSDASVVQETFHFSFSYHVGLDSLICVLRPVQIRSILKPRSLQSKL